MEVKFKNITKCTKSLYNDFLKFHDEKYKTRTVLTNLIISIAILYMLGFNIKYNNYFIVIFIVLIAILGFYISNKHQKDIVKKEMKSKRINQQEEMEFYFYNKYYFVVRTNKKRQVIRYFKIYRINEDDKNFYLYLDKTHAFIVSKEGFAKGNAEQFKKFMIQKFKFKYVK